MNRIYAFADISGFTPLTASLIAKSRYGAEEVSDLVNSVFGGIISAVHENGGMVLLFAGDALLFTVDADRLEICRERFGRHINSYNRSNNVSLSISIDIFTEQYYPHKLKYRNSSLLFFSTGRSNIAYESVNTELNPVYPREIGEMHKRGFTGELRTLPVAFIHIDSVYTTKQLNPLFYEIMKNSVKNRIYLNKIEYADKGWMILLGAGMPVPLKNANLILYRALEHTRGFAKKLNIGMGAGVTLQRGFAGIIGNRDRWEFTYMGNNVNLAARMAVDADDYTILCDKHMAESLSRYFDVASVKNIQYKGMDSRTDVLQLKPMSSLKESDVFVGRDKTISDIMKHLSRENTAVLVTGEGGIGKTSMVRQMERGSENPYVFLSGDRREIPLSGLLTLDSKIELYVKQGVPIKKGNVKDRFFEIITSLDRDIVIVIDNAHLLDPQSLNIIKWLFIEGNEHVRIIVVQRPVNRFEIHKSPLSKYNTAEFDLKGMNKRTVESFVTEYFNARPDSDSINHIFRLSQGNPLYINQLLNYLAKEKLVNIRKGGIRLDIDLNKLPYSLKELILMKFDSLKNIERHFIETGSVIGDEFRNDIPATVTGNLENTQFIIKNAANSNLLSPKDSRISMFYHNIVRETIYDRMLKKDIDRISIKIADYLGKSDNAMDLFQAGRFYSIANDERAADLFIASAHAFNAKKEYEYAAHSLKNAFSTRPDIRRMDRAMDILHETGEYHMDGDLLESAYNALEHNGFETENYGNLLKIGFHYTQIQRNVKKASKLLDFYEKKEGVSIDSNMLRASIMGLEEDMDGARGIYLKLLQQTEDKEQIMSILVSFAYLSFILRSDKKDTAYAISRMKSIIKNVKNSSVKRDYYDFMITYNIHINDMKKASFYAAKQKRAAMKNNDKTTLTHLLNTYAILYSSKAVKEKNPRYYKIAHRYSKEMYETMKRDMQMNVLPLITTNLAMSYMKTGMAFKALQLYHEGLLYGREVNHYIEIPYNLGILAGFAMNRKAEKLAVKLSNEIMEKWGKSDMTVLAGTLIYLLKNNKLLLKQSISSAEKFLEMGHPLPYLFHYSALFNQYIRNRDMVNLTELKEDLSGFLKRSRLRPAQKIDIIEKIRVIDMMEGAVDIKYIDRYLRITKTGRIYRDAAVFYCSLACTHLKGSSRIKYAKTGYRYARRMLMPLYAEEFAGILAECGYNRYYYKKRESEIKSLRENIVKTQSVPDFIDLFKTL